MNPRNHFKPVPPRALRTGDTLGIVAPASPFDRKLFGAGVRVLESMGFSLAIREAVFNKQGYLAGSDQSRADLLNQLFADPGIDGIICARGGYGTMRILPLLDVKTIACHPKVFVGFSDITALLVFLIQRCHMAVFHGPTVTTLGNGDASTIHHFRSALTRPKPLTISTASNQVISAGRATGRFLCGNLTLFSHLTGTPYQPDFNDCILLVEDQGEAPYRIDRMFTQMLLAGCFDKLAGLALGSFNRCGAAEEIHRIVADRMGGLNIPVLAGFDVGHDPVNTTLPVGLPVQLDTSSGTLTFSGPAVRDR